MIPGSKRIENLLSPPNGGTPNRKPSVRCTAFRRSPPRNANHESSVRCTAFRRSSPAVTAFTLIELLVVVTIISVLAALLLPGLGAARDRAKRVGCASNFRQILAGSFTFANDHSGVLPSVMYNDGYGTMGSLASPGSGSDYSIAPFYIPYLGLSFSFTGARLNVPKLLVCPGIDYNTYNIAPNLTTTPAVWLARIGDSLFGYRVGFGSFLGLRSGTFTGTTFVNGTGVQLSTFSVPSSEFVMFDLLSYHWFAPTQWLTPHGQGNQQGGLNEGFADGSVRWFNWKQVNRQYWGGNYNGDRRIYYYFYCPPNAQFNYGGYPLGPTTYQMNWVGVNTGIQSVYTP